MGLYDMLPQGSQVRLWDCNMGIKKVGDTVQRYKKEYIVLLQEGGYVRVVDGIITKIVEDNKPKYPEEFDVPCFDKWGNAIISSKDLNAASPFGYDYYWNMKEK